MEEKESLANQQETEQELDRFFTNFSKDGPSRKTADKLKLKLQYLETLWDTYQANHMKLCGLGIKSDRYFIENHYQRVQDKYFRYKDIISGTTPYVAPSLPQVLPSLPLPLSREGDDTQQQRNMPSFRASEPIPSTSQGTSSKLDEMYRKQQSNLRAFQRTLDSIDVNSLKEKWELEDALSTIQSRWRIIDSLHLDLDSELEGSNPAYDNDFIAFEKIYYNIKKEINSKLWSNIHQEKSTPKINIPYFEGDYQQWVSFKDLFIETIHSNNSLSNAQKMQFLKSRARGEAEKLIQHLQISSDNYITAWDILNHRYNNKKLIFSCHLNNILSLPVLREPSVESIKRMHDTIIESINAIKNLSVEVSTWDPFLVHILSQKLDSQSLNDYLESVSQPRELPNLKEFLDFLEGKFISMETMGRKQESTSQKAYSSYRIKQGQVNKPSYNINKNYNVVQSNNMKMMSAQNATRPDCTFCQAPDHGLYYCEKFLRMPPYLKRKKVRELNLCQNCLYDHRGGECMSDKRCKICQGKHNTILHEAFIQQNTGPHQSNQLRKYTSNVSTSYQDSEILLATAIINVLARDGREYRMRVLIDQGSQTSIITEHAAQLLGLSRKPCSGTITGVGDRESDCKGMLTITCKSIYDNYSFDCDVIIMNKLIKNLPSRSLASPEWEYIQSIQLADPEFYISRPVDLLFGADIYCNIIMDGMYHPRPYLPLAQKTKIGWILSGHTPSPSYHCNVILNNIDEIKKFWEIEDISQESSLSSEDEYCIRLYESTTVRKQDGKYEVRIPFKKDFQKELGLSKPKAIAQFRCLESKLNRDSKIKNEYKLFINEYQALGHMTPDTDIMSKYSYYLPHHCVIREDSITTKLRVVFNASSITTSGKSLNDLMYRGPNLQQDLQGLILKWRQYEIAYSADIEKMFRCIWVAEEDQQYQKIIWRSQNQDKMSSFKLTTVTYGTKSAPFLSMMTLKRLAKDEYHKIIKNQQEQNLGYKLSAIKAIEDSFYMDDLLYGNHSILSAQETQKALIDIMEAGGFHLRKWKSNRQEMLQGMDENENFDFKQMESTKTLGLTWQPKQDSFAFQSQIELEVGKLTKRSLLSSISKLFDPMGWLSPLSTKMKILFQKVWLSQIKWDDELPLNIKQEWSKIKQDITCINLLSVPRWYGTSGNSKIELHGFCDASEKAYGCVIYCKINKKPGEKSSVVLVVGKARLTPANKQVSLPRLELSSALLLAKTIEKVKGCLSNYESQIVCWSDSKVAIAWIQGNPDKWKPFVANRVKQICEVISSDSWHYVKSDCNPADCVSRGLTASQLKDHSIWWKGPQWLSTYSCEQEKQLVFETEQESKKIKQVNVVIEKQESIYEKLLARYSSLSKVINILAWLRRPFLLKKNVTKKEQYLTLQEIKQAKYMLIRYMQQEYFYQEINDLKKHKQVNSKSSIFNLNPYLDKDDILRVGGRLRNAYISNDMKYPILVPKNCRFSELLIKQSHLLVFHGGPKLTQSFIRQKYWVVGGNAAIKKEIRKCVICRKHNPTKHNQMMGDLPEARTNPIRPFFKTGVDFTGHIMLKANTGRGIKTTKGYVAVFVCMATKAIHLEVVSDLTSSAFIAALRRMASRRGTPGHIFSDNGKNFVGANRLLQQEYQEIEKIFNQEFSKEIVDMKIQWHFNAPLWPSAGGLWESAVKSLKFHLKRVIGEQKLTFEEMSTLLAQLEACLNTRPLYPLTEDPRDLDFLSPSHFLACGPTLTILETENDARTRWHLVKKIYQDIWKRWKSEYLSQLTERSKWNKIQENIKLNDIVLIHDDNLPPGKWGLGRVIETHPGRDNLVRVVTLKTKSGVMKRPITKISYLPVNENSISKSEQENSKKEQAPKIKKQSNFITLAIAFLLFITTLTSVECSTYKITKFKENQGLFFDKLSDINIIRDDWTIITFYDLNPYWQGIIEAEKYINQLDEICMKIRTEIICDVVVLQLRHRYSELVYYNNLLLNQQAHTRQRARRGLINGIGYAANSLFGVLDERFAEKYEQDIKVTRSNEQHLLNLYKNQTSIIESEVNLIKRTEDSLNSQQKKVNQYFIKLDDILNRQGSQIHVLMIINSFNTGVFAITGILQSLQEIQTMLLDTATDIYQGQFNYHMFTQEQLQQEINLISRQISKDLIIPINNVQNDITKIFHILKVKARLTENYFIFEIKIPLISRDSMELYRIIPIPYRTKNKYISITPISDYVALNMKKDLYLPIDRINLQECLHQDKQTMLCRIQKPLYQIQSDEILCKMDQKSSKCLLNTANECIEQWISISASNTFVYLCCDSCAARVICEDQVSFVQLEAAAGLININNGCLIKTKQMTLYSANHQESTYREKIDIAIPKLSEINFMWNMSMLNQNVSFQSEENTYKNIDQAINEIHSRIDGIKNNQEFPEVVSNHDVHQYVAIYGLVAVLGLVAMVYWCSKCRCHSHKRERRASAARAAAAGEGGALPLRPLRQQAHSSSSVQVNHSISDHQCDCNQSVNVDQKLKAANVSNVCVKNVEQVKCENENPKVDKCSSPIKRASLWYQTR